MNKIQLEDDITKYKKKKNSSTSKSKEKSKHKHNYKDCLLIVKDKKTPCKAAYCTICGKINNCNVFETTPYENGYLRILNAEEIYEKYKDLEKIYVDDIWQKYVSISRVGD